MPGPRRSERSIGSRLAIQIVVIATRALGIGKGLEAVRSRHAGDDVDGAREGMRRRRDGPLRLSEHASPRGMSRQAALRLARLSGASPAICVWTSATAPLTTRIATV